MLALLLLCAVAAPGVAAGAGEEGTSPPPTSEDGGVVVRLAGPGCPLDELLARHELGDGGAVLASRGIHRVHPTEPTEDPKDAEKLAEDTAKDLAKDDCVTFAEADRGVALVDDRRQFHSWTPGAPAVSDEPSWRDQVAVRELGLARAGLVTQGAGSVVAVLDTGVAPGHPVLEGHVTHGWDYVDDDGSPLDAPCGCDPDGDGQPDSAVGHGTFVAGTVALVAPGATVRALRVLDSDGRGSIFTVAQAILDAVNGGADVINISFGTEGKLKSKLIDEALKEAKRQDVLVVAAAGNSGRKSEHYPANSKRVWSVAALDATNQRLAAFSTRGGWVDVAATGEGLVGPVPGGFARWSGTSVAAPIVAGQFALLHSLAPDVEGKKLRESVHRAAQKVDGVDVKSGRIDIPESLVEVSRHVH